MADVIVIMLPMRQAGICVLPKFMELAQGKCKPLAQVQRHSQHNKCRHFPTRVSTINLPMLSLNTYFLSIFNF